MKIAISGASGLVGEALVPYLRSKGHQVYVVVRDEPAPGEIRWKPDEGMLDIGSLEGIDAVINLSGENVAGRWTADKKKRILQSRISATRTWVEAIKELPSPPKVFINASAVGYYGNAGSQVLDEASPKGRGFLSDLCQHWEEELKELEKLNIRVVPVRIGVVISPEGGALGKMLIPFKLGLGGQIGSGDQYMSWISLEDLLAIFQLILTDNTIKGPVNAAAPNPVTNKEFTKTLGKVLHRPTIFPMPAFAARLAFGEMADEMLLSSTRVRPAKLEKAGFAFSYPTLESCLGHYFGENKDVKLQSGRV